MKITIDGSIRPDYRKDKYRLIPLNLLQGRGWAASHDRSVRDWSAGAVVSYINWIRMVDHLEVGDLEGSQVTRAERYAVPGSSRTPIALRGEGNFSAVGVIHAIALQGARNDLCGIA